MEGEAGDGNARSLISPILINQIKLNQNVFIRPHFIPRGTTMHFTEGNGGDSDVRLNGTQSSWLHWVLPVHHRCARTTDVHRRLTQKSWSWDGCCQYTLCPRHSQFQSLTRTQNKTRYYKRLLYCLGKQWETCLVLLVESHTGHREVTLFRGEMYKMSAHWGLIPS